VTSGVLSRNIIENRDYLRAVETAVNFVFRLVPMLVTAVMITTEISAARRPYSMAVTPRSSFTKRETRDFIDLAPKVQVQCLS
jgi:succinate dehydrogenase/fumarate reductase flavoprotein subunit